MTSKPFYIAPTCSVKKLFLACFSLLSFAAHSQSASDIVSKYIQFIGGSDNWKKIKTITSTGTYNYGGVEFPFQSYSKAPDLYKYIVTFNGKSFEQAYDGKTGWRIDGFKNEKQKTILNGKDAIAMANESDVELESPFIDYDKKGHSISLEGKDSVDGKMCYVIKLNRRNGDTEKYFFSSDNYMLVKKQAIAKNTELQKDLLDIFYTDYRSVNNITIPYKITFRSGLQTVLVISITDLQLDLPVKDEIFKP